MGGLGVLCNLGKRAAALAALAALLVGAPGLLQAADPGMAVWDAAAKNDLAEVRKLAEEGAPVNTLHDSRTPLISAVEFRNLEMARVLLEHGADPDTPMPPMDVPPLSLAVLKRFRDIAHLLIEKGADVNLVDKQGRTAILYAGANSETELLQALMRAGADIDVQDPEGSTPLWLAAGFGDFASVRILVEAGARRDLLGSCYKWGKQECTAAEVARFKRFYNIASYLDAAGGEAPAAPTGKAQEGKP